MLFSHLVSLVLGSGGRVGVGVGGICVGVAVGATVDVGAGVAVGAGVDVAVGVGGGGGVAVAVGVDVVVGVGVDVAVGVGERVGIAVGVNVGAGVAAAVGTIVAVGGIGAVGGSVRVTVATGAAAWRLSSPQANNTSANPSSTTSIKEILDIIHRLAPLARINYWPSTR